MKKFCVLLLVIVIASCKDDPPTIEEQLTAPADGWVFDSVIAIDPDTGNQVDLVRDPKVFIPCTLDDALVFKTDGTYVVMTNQKCVSTDPDIADTGTWKLSDDKSELTVFSNDTNKVIMELDAFSISDTKFKGETSSLGDLPVLAIVTLRKKGTY